MPHVSSIESLYIVLLAQPFSSMYVYVLLFIRYAQNNGICFSIVGSLCDREVGCLASDRQASRLRRLKWHVPYNHSRLQRFVLKKIEWGIPTELLFVQARPPEILWKTVMIQNPIPYTWILRHDL